MTTLQDFSFPDPNRREEGEKNAFSPSRQVSERPDFLTPTLWSAYLVRSDVRRGRSIYDREAARDFCCWWLIAGKNEYPTVWCVNESIVEVALEPVDFRGAHVPRFLSYLWRINPEIQNMFPRVGRNEIAAYLSWYVLSGFLVLDYAPLLPSRFVDVVNEAPFKKLIHNPLSHLEQMALRIYPELKPLGDETTATGRGLLAAAFREKMKRIHSRVASLPPPPIDPRPVASADVVDFLVS